MINGVGYVEELARHTYNGLDFIVGALAGWLVDSKAHPYGVEDIKTGAIVAMEVMMVCNILSAW